MSANRFLSHRSMVLGALMVLILLAGCRRVATIEPTLQPTATYTPRSTPLPTVATPPPPGDADNPLDVIFVRPPALSRSAVDNAAADLQAALSEATGLSLNVRTVDAGADAVQALCDSPDGQPAVAWVDGVTYAAARAQGCAFPQLLIQRDGSAGAAVVIIVPSRSPADDARGLAGETFCRLASDDLYSWIVPSLLLRVGGLSPTQLGAIQDYDDTSELVSAVASGDCGAAGIAQSDLEALSAGNRVREIANANVPYSILVMPNVVPLGVRETLNSAMLAAANDPDQAALLQPLLGQSGMFPVQADTLEGWDEFIRQTRLDFAVMGQ